MSICHGQNKDNRIQSIKRKSIILIIFPISDHLRRTGCASSVPTLRARYVMLFYKNTLKLRVYENLGEKVNNPSLTVPNEIKKLHFNEYNTSFLMENLVKIPNICTYSF